MEPENRLHQDEKAKRDAAARVVREQLDAIYHDQSNIADSTSLGNHAPKSTAQSKAQSSQPQFQNPSTSGGSESGSYPQHVQEYHSKWQEYYQRYYESYYVSHLHKAMEKFRGSEEPDSIPVDDNVKTLRQSIINKARDTGKKARNSRHFVPVISGLVVFAVIAFVQYNQFIFANVQAYVSPGAIDPQNIVVDPSTNTATSPEPKLIIPKINVDVPVIYDVSPEHDSQMAAMQKGVAHFAIAGADSVPGQKGNTVFSGHSSNDLFDPGDYKFIFVQLDKLIEGDTIYVNYNSVRYTYTVTKKEVVLPSQVDKLTVPSDKPILTLITCTPVGTAQKRLLVTAEQVAPDPAKARPANPLTTSGNATMTGNAPTLLERLFGNN